MCKKRGEVLSIDLREATSVDAPAIVLLIRALARVMDVVTPVDEAHVREYIASRGSGYLVADDPGQAVRVLSWSPRAGLVDAGRACDIEELVIDQTTQPPGRRRPAGGGSATTDGGMGLRGGLFIGARIA